MRRVQRFVRDVRPGDHIVLYYESQGFKHEVLFTYLKSSLERGKKTLYISHREAATDIVKGMRSFGIEVERYAKKGLLELWEIIPDLRPITVQPLFNDPPSVGPFPSLLTYFEGKMIKKPVVVVVDDPLQNTEPEIAVNCEKFHSLRLEHTPMSMICTYSTEEVSRNGRLFLDLVKAHRHIIIQTEGTIISLEDAR